MHSRITGKVKVVMTVLGFTLGASVLRGDWFDVFFHKNHTSGFQKFCEHVAGLHSGYIRHLWEKEGKCDVSSCVTHSDCLSKVKGIPDGCTPDLLCCCPGNPKPVRPSFFLDANKKDTAEKITQAITQETKGAENIRKYLKFLCNPLFARVFFTRKMFEHLPCKLKCDKWGHPLPRGGRLCCDVVQKKLRKDSPAFEDFGKYTLYLVRYTEKFSGCFFEMIYCFTEEGMCAGWYPTRLMAEWMVRAIVTGRRPDEADRVAWCRLFSNFGFRVSHTLGIKDFE